MSPASPTSRLSLVVADVAALLALQGPLSNREVWDQLEAVGGCNALATLAPERRKARLDTILSEETLHGKPPRIIRVDGKLTLPKPNGPVEAPIVPWQGSTTATVEPKKSTKHRKLGSLDAMEAARKRLGLTEREFSVAIGYDLSTYTTMLTRKAVTLTAQLAAEALVRRQGSSGQPDQLYLLKIVKGVPHLTTLAADDMQQITLNGAKFLMVPAETAK